MNYGNDVLPCYYAKPLIQADDVYDFFIMDKSAFFHFKRRKYEHFFIIIYFFYLWYFIFNAKLRINNAYRLRERSEAEFPSSERDVLHVKAHSHNSSVFRFIHSRKFLGNDVFSATFYGLKLMPFPTLFLLHGK